MAKTKMTASQISSSMKSEGPKRAQAATRTIQNSNRGAAVGRTIGRAVAGPLGGAIGGALGRRTGSRFAKGGYVKKGSSCGPMAKKGKK